jgi:hypothetical protein
MENMLLDQFEERFQLSPPELSCCSDDRQMVSNQTGIVFCFRRCKMIFSSALHDSILLGRKNELSEEVCANFSIKKISFN